ncbi:MAG: transcriptional regulator NrdR [Thermodesulfobacteriota bacterium]
MKCPFCNYIEDKVIDSRIGKDGETIRRRRECLKCESRFTTYERIEDVLPLVIKKDGRRETFDRAKVLTGIQKACEKRPVSINEVETVVEKLEKRFRESGEREIPSFVVGEAIMDELKLLDKVAYVRFASVYRQFKDINEFMAELSDLLNVREKKKR